MTIPLSFEVRFILLALAVFRAAELITLDRGPRDIFLSLRIFLGAYDRDESGEPRTELGRLVECPYCTGVWLALPALLVLLFVPFPTETPTSLWEGIAGVLWLGALWLALAGAQAAIETLAGRAQAKTITVALDERAQGTLDSIAEHRAD